MMQRIIYAAVVLLVLQIGLAVFFYSSTTSGLNAAAPDTPFLSFSPDKITAVEISAADSNKLILQKTGKGWNMPEAFSAPASSGEVEELLKKAAVAKQGLAVASTKGAAKRFKTADREFVRHLVFKAGEAAAADFYLGTSAGFRQSYARAKGRDEVVSIPVSEFEAEADADKWLDKSIAILNRDELQAVALADISLSKKDKDWQLDGAAAGEADKGEIDKLLDKVTGLSVQSALDPAKAAPLFAQPLAAQFTVTKKDGGKLTYALAKQDDHYVLKMSASELYFKIGSTQAEALAGMKREKLLAAKKEEAAEKPAGQNAPEQKQEEPATTEAK